ncbi:MAG: hypothetical protein GEU81_06625, partial [Nitriliruptorales bacterium]|nr:hypothetical protein [Nitriliruptorales bacterium]
MDPDTQMWPQGGRRNADPDSQASASFATNPFPRADDADDRDETLVQPAQQARVPPPAGRGHDPGPHGGRGRGWPPILASALVAAIVSALVTLGITGTVQENGPAAGQQAPATGDPAPTRVRQGGGSVAEVAESVLPSVARVDVNGSAGS